MSAAPNVLVLGEERFLRRSPTVRLHQALCSLRGMRVRTFHSNLEMLEAAKPSVVVIFSDGNTYFEFRQLVSERWAGVPVIVVCPGPCVSSAQRGEVQFLPVSTSPQDLVAAVYAMATG